MDLLVRGYWIAGLLDCWIVGLLDCWKIKTFYQFNPKKL